MNSQSKLVGNVRLIRWCMLMAVAVYFVLMARLPASSHAAQLGTIEIAVALVSLACVNTAFYFNRKFVRKAEALMQQSPDDVKACEKMARRVRGHLCSEPCYCTLRASVAFSWGTILTCGPIFRRRNDLSKVPAVTLTFWVIKILATTFGETGGDAVSMSMNLGYVIASIIFLGIFASLIAAQIAAKSFHPFLYWAVIIATTTLGTTLADFADRSLGIGYAGGSSLLFILLMSSLVIWYKSTGSVSVETITSPKVEMFYWGTILFSQTLGTALGDWMADTNRLGYEGGALVFGAGLALVAAAYFFTSVSAHCALLGRFLSSRDRSAQPWATCSTSRLTTAALRSGSLSASGILALLSYLPASCSSLKRPEAIPDKIAGRYRVDGFASPAGPGDRY